MKNLYPDVYFGSVFELSPEFFRSRAITHLIFDLDDTLAFHGDRVPSEQTCAFLRSFSESGLSVSLISNNAPERVDTFNAPLKLFAIAHAGKPKKKALDPFFRRFDAKPNEVALIGDQLFTDVLLAHRCGVYAVLVKPIHPVENRFFLLKRALEKPILRRYFRKTEQANQSRKKAKS